MVRKKPTSFGREYLVVSIPVIVITLPSVNVPLAIVPVHVHHEASRTQDCLYHHP